MSNRRIEMYEYRQVLQQMRQKESDRAIAKAGLVSRTKAKAIRTIAVIKGWLNSNCPLPDDTEIANVVLENKSSQSKSTSKVAMHSE
jgi:hypothetical protein